MNQENIHNTPPPKPAGKTTLTFRLDPNIKLHIAATAKGLGMSPSQYVEALIMKRHSELVATLKEPEKPKLPAKQTPVQNLIEQFVEKLSASHPSATKEELIAAALHHAYSNKGALWQRSLKTYLTRNNNLLTD